MPFAGAVRGTMGSIFRTDRKLHFVKAKLFDLAAVLAVLILFIVLAASRAFSSWGFLEPVLQWRFLAAVFRAMGTFLLTLAVISFFYVVFARVRLKWTHLLAGGATAAILLAAIRPLFGLVLQFNPNYGYAFGSLKVGFLLIVWAYYTFAALLFERKSSPRPGGKRRFS